MTYGIATIVLRGEGRLPITLLTVRSTNAALNAERVGVQNFSYYLNMASVKSALDKVVHPEAGQYQGPMHGTSDAHRRD
jgi:hypothetical protein